MNQRGAELRGSSAWQRQVGGWNTRTPSHRALPCCATFGRGLPLSAPGFLTCEARVVAELLHRVVRKTSRASTTPDT